MIPFHIYPFYLKSPTCCIPKLQILSILDMSLPLLTTFSFLLFSETGFHAAWLDLKLIVQTEDDFELLIL